MNAPWKASMPGNRDPFASFLCDEAALEVLRYAHGWAAKQAIEVTVDQKISIIAALEDAQRRVIDLTVQEIVTDEIRSD